MAIIVGSGDYKYRIIEDWAKLPDGWSFKEVGAVGCDKQRQRLCLQSRRAPDDGVRPRRQFPALLGRGAVSAGARRPYGARRFDLPDRRRRPSSSANAGSRRQGAAGARRARQARALYVAASRFTAAPTPRSSPKGDIYVSDGYGNSRVHKYSPDGKLLMSWGEPGTDAGRVQHRPQHLHRRRRLGLCRRPREPPHPGVRRQRQVRGAVEQPAPAVRDVHGLCPPPGLLYRRIGPGAVGQPRRPQSRAAGQHRRQQGQSACRALATGMPAPRRPRFSGRTAWPSTCAAISMSARCRGRNGRNSIPDKPRPDYIRSLQKYERVR